MDSNAVFTEYGYSIVLTPVSDNGFTLEFSASISYGELTDIVCTYWFNRSDDVTDVLQRFIITVIQELTHIIGDAPATVNGPSQRQQQAFGAKVSLTFILERLRHPVDVAIRNVLTDSA